MLITVICFYFSLKKEQLAWMTEWNDTIEKQHEVRTTLMNEWSKNWNATMDNIKETVDKLEVSHQKEVDRLTEVTNNNWEALNTWTEECNKIISAVEKDTEELKKAVFVKAEMIGTTPKTVKKKVTKKK